MQLARSPSSPRSRLPSRVEAARLQAEQAVDAATRDLRLAKVGLAYLLGARALVPDLDVVALSHRSAASGSLSGATREALLQTALEHRPDVRLQAAQLRRADAAKDLAKRLVAPDLALNLAYQQEGTGDNALSPPTLTFGVSVPLPLLYQYEGEVQRAEADRAAAAAGSAKTAAQVVADVETAFAAFQAAAKRLDRMETGGLLASVKKAKELVFVQYQKGAASLLEVLDAQRTFIATNADYLATLTDYQNALFALEQATGKDLGG